jgi:hypothetical protein
MKGFIGVREAKKTVKYRLPIDKEQVYLHGKLRVER